MNTLWNIFKKPFVWKPLFILSVVGINLFLKHGLGTMAIWTFFSIIFVIIVASPYGKPRDRKTKSFLEKEADSRRLIYGSQFIHSMSVRRKTLGY